MELKQENASEDSAAVVKDIIKQFQAVNLPRLADIKLYSGIPFTVLDNFRHALAEQCFENDKKKFLNRLKYAGIAKERTSDTFKWDGNTYPLAEPGIIERALSIDFIKQRKNLIVAGPPGTGKSLLVTIVACKALWANLSVKYKTGHDIAIDLKEARIGNSLSGYIKKLQSCDALFIEDVIFATFDNKSAQSFFSIIDGRYGRKSTVITSNGNINDWAASFPDKRMSSALLGRFYEDALLVNMNGAEDFRLKQAKRLLDNSGLAGADRVCP